MLKKLKNVAGIKFPSCQNICNFGGINFSGQPQISEIREI